MGPGLRTGRVSPAPSPPSQAPGARQSCFSLRVPSPLLLCLFSYRDGFLLNKRLYFSQKNILSRIRGAGQGRGGEPGWFLVLRKTRGCLFLHGDGRVSRLLMQTRALRLQDSSWCHPSTPRWRTASRGTVFPRQSRVPPGVPGEKRACPPTRSGERSMRPPRKQASFFAAAGLRARLSCGAL